MPIVADQKAIAETTSSELFITTPLKNNTKTAES
jgi:hypothetical protein